MNKLIIPLKHYNLRPADIVVDMIVVHYISAMNLDKDKWSDLGLILGIFGQYKLSAHYLIERSGRIIEMVEPALRSWHAGKSEYKGRNNCNDYSIGVELVGGSFIDFEPLQYDSFNKLTNNLKENYSIKNIVGHEEIALPKGRKKDPGKRFDWDRIPNIK
tara:strand:- start:2049 stop:2528 length:480 start_codon:yes stop_codon:yes gene_type:complete